MFFSKASSWVSSILPGSSRQRNEKEIWSDSSDEECATPPIVVTPIQRVAPDLTSARALLSSLSPGTFLQWSKYGPERQVTSVLMDKNGKIVQTDHYSAGCLAYKSDNASDYPNNTSFEINPGAFSINRGDFGKGIPVYSEAYDGETGKSIGEATMGHFKDMMGGPDGVFFCPKNSLPLSSYEGWQVTEDGHPDDPKIIQANQAHKSRMMLTGIRAGIDRYNNMPLSYQPTKKGNTLFATCSSPVTIFSEEDAVVSDSKGHSQVLRRKVQPWMKYFHPSQCHLETTNGHNVPAEWRVVFDPRAARNT